MKKGVLSVLLAAVCWGMLPIIAGFLYREGITPLQTAAIRSYMAAGIFLLSSFRSWKKLKTVQARHLPFYVAYGFFAITSLYIVYLTAVKYVSAAIACTLMYTAPAFVILFSRLLYKEAITRQKLIGICVTFLGCAFVVRLYDVQSLAVNQTGILLGLLAGLCYSSLTLFGKKGIALYSSDINALLPALFGAFFMLFIMPPWEIPFPSAKITGLYALLGLIGSVLPYIFYMKGLQNGLDGGTASLIATLEPVAATLFGVFLLGDSLDIIQAVGIFLVVLGAALPVLRKK